MKKDPERDHKQWTFSCICQKYDWFQCFEATYSKDTCQFILKRTSEQKDNQRHLNKHTLPKTNSSPLKIGHPKKEIYIFQVSIFRCKLAVSFRVPGIQDPCWYPTKKIDVSIAGGSTLDWTWEGSVQSTQLQRCLFVGGLVKHVLSKVIAVDGRNPASQVVSRISDLWHVIIKSFNDFINSFLNSLLDIWYQPFVSMTFV